jgi:cell division septal protein FtsQ
VSRRKPLNDEGARTLTKVRPGRPTRSPSSTPRRDTSPPRETRPRRWRFVKVTLVVIAVVATLALGGRWVLHTSYFRVQNVTIVGLHHESERQVLVASGLESHPTMLGLSAGSIERNLSRFTWITGLSIVKHWPSTLVVRVHESTPVAVAFGVHHVLEYVDRAGRDLGAAPLHVNLPTLQYLHPRSAAWPFLHAGLAAAYVAGRLPVAFGAQVSLITVDAKGSVTLTMTTPVSFVLGPVTQLHAKFVAIASVISHSTLRPGDVVDVTVPDELAVTGPAPS